MSVAAKGGTVIMDRKDGVAPYHLTGVDGFGGDVAEVIRASTED